MASGQEHWEIYNNEMTRKFDFGHALWEPAPPENSKCVQIGDVAFIRRGRVEILFSAGCPLGDRQLGVDVPPTFRQLDTGEINEREPLVAGCFCTDGVRPVSRLRRLRNWLLQLLHLPSASTISLKATGKQGAALLTKHSTYRQDARRVGIFEKYTKEHHASWVAFARETGYSDVNPVLVTGVDRTKDFAMLCYSDNSNKLKCKFVTSAPGITSVWGTWEKPGLVHTNVGPQPRLPSSTQPGAPSSSGNSLTDEYNQCVFIRYLTMRKRLGVPRIIKAAAGPHDLGGRGADGEGPLLEARRSPGSGSEIASSSSNSDGGDGGSSFTSIDTESDVVVHNTTTDKRDSFDTIAAYVFQNSNAESVLLHHRDVILLRGPGGDVDFPTQLPESCPQIAVDENGVGVIRHKTDLPPETRSNDFSDNFLIPQHHDETLQSAFAPSYTPPQGPSPGGFLNLAGFQRQYPPQDSNSPFQVPSPGYPPPSWPPQGQYPPPTRPPPDEGHHQPPRKNEYQPPSGPPNQNQYQPPSGPPSHNQYQPPSGFQTQRKSPSGPPQQGQQGPNPFNQNDGGYPGSSAYRPPDGPPYSQGPPSIPGIRPLAPPNNDAPHMPNFERQFVGGVQKAGDYTKKTRTNSADVVSMLRPRPILRGWRRAQISWSGCRDSQASADAFEAGQATGAMGFAFISVLTSNKNQTYQSLLNGIRNILKSKYSQKPQLAASHPIDTNAYFIC